MTGETVEVNAVVRKLPAASQVRQSDGTLRLIRSRELRNESLAAAAHLELEGRKLVAKSKSEPAERLPSLDFGVANGGSNSSCTDRYYLSGEKVRTTTSGVTQKLRLRLRNRTSLTVHVGSVIGGLNKIQDVELLQNRMVPVRLMADELPGHGQGTALVNAVPP